MIRVMETTTTAKENGMQFSSEQERDEYETFAETLRRKGYVKVEYDSHGNPYVVAQWNEGNCRMELVAEYDDWMRAVLDDQLALAQWETDGGY
jgi:hypothetical protein